MKIGYLEIVTPDVDGTCKMYSVAYGIEFSGPVAALGNARTTQLPGGGKLGIRAPMRESEAPVVRPYFEVDNIESTVESIRGAGGEIAVPPMQLPGEGFCAIALRGGIDHGIWQSENKG